MPETLLYSERGDARHTYNTDLLHRLRTETREVHQALERDLDLTRTASTIANYRRLLERFYGFYQSFEPAAIDALPSKLHSFFEPRKGSEAGERSAISGKPPRGRGNLFESAGLE